MLGQQGHHSVPVIDYQRSRTISDASEATIRSDKSASTADGVRRMPQAPHSLLMLHVPGVVGALRHPTELLIGCFAPC